MLNRWYTYFHETVRPASTISVIALVVIGITCMFQVLLGEEELVLTIKIVPTIAVYFSLILYWRIIDEFKDYDIDRRFFPDRPVPSGRVNLSDLRILLWVVCVLMFAMAILSNLPLIPLILIYLYEVLQGRWFLLKKQIANNRLLAFVTHAPSAFLFNSYVIAVHCKQFGIPLFKSETLFVAAWFSLPFLAHEFARKTRAPSEEQEGYQTYSAMIGFRGSATVCMAFVIAHWTLLLAASIRMQVSTPLLVFTSLLAAAYVAVFVAFAVRPEGRSKLLRPATEIYLLFSFLGTTVYMAASHSLTWR